MMRRQQATHVRPHHPNPTRVRPPACRLVTLRNAIRNSFKDVGKGWFNLGESSQETYEFSKLKKFLALTRFVMEDTLRFLVEDSAARFTTFMQARRAAAGRGGAGREGRLWRGVRPVVAAAAVEGAWLRPRVHSAVYLPMCA